MGWLSISLYCKASERRTKIMTVQPGKRPQLTSTWGWFSGSWQVIGTTHCCKLVTEVMTAPGNTSSVTHMQCSAEGTYLMTNSKDGQAWMVFLGFPQAFCRAVSAKPTPVGWWKRRGSQWMIPWMIPWQVLYFNVLSGERVTQETVKNCSWKDWSCPMAWHTWLAEVEGQMAQVLIVYIYIYNISII